MLTLSREKVVSSFVVKSLGEAGDGIHVYVFLYLCEHYGDYFRVN